LELILLASNAHHEVRFSEVQGAVTERIGEVTMTIQHVERNVVGIGGNVRDLSNELNGLREEGERGGSGACCGGNFVKPLKQLNDRVLFFGVTLSLLITIGLAMRAR
jgi:hypothetical protein